MIAGVCVALAWSLLQPGTYTRFTQATRFSSLNELGIGSIHLLVVNGALTFFFLLVGLELAREFRSGGLKHWNQLSNPLLAAVGGMLFTAVPMATFGLISHQAILTKSWGVPMATDIALTLAALSLLGTRVPREVRLFVLALAILDDVGSVIALAFVHPLQFSHWLVAAACLALGAFSTWLWRRGRKVALWPSLLLVWLALQRMGVDPALAGVVVGVFDVGGAQGLKRERTLASVNAYFILPFFALVATGVELNRSIFSGQAGSLLFALFFVRLFGKGVGIFIGVRTARLLGAKPIASLSPRALFGVGLLCSVGFTVPLVFASAVAQASSLAYNAITIALLGASLVGASLGLALLRVSFQPTPDQLDN